MTKIETVENSGSVILRRNPNLDFSYTGGEQSRFVLGDIEDWITECYVNGANGQSPILFLFSPSGSHIDGLKVETPTAFTKPAEIRHYSARAVHNVVILLVCLALLLGLLL